MREICFPVEGDLTEHGAVAGWAEGEVEAAVERVREALRTAYGRELDALGGAGGRSESAGLSAAAQTTAQTAAQTAGQTAAQTAGRTAGQAVGEVTERAGMQAFLDAPRAPVSPSSAVAVPAGADGAYAGVTAGEIRAVIEDYGLHDLPPSLVAHAYRTYRARRPMPTLLGPQDLDTLRSRRAEHLRTIVEKTLSHSTGGGGARPLDAPATHEEIRLLNEETTTLLAHTAHEARPDTQHEPAPALEPGLLHELRTSVRRHIHELTTPAGTPDTRPPTDQLPDPVLVTTYWKQLRTTVWRKDPLHQQALRITPHFLNPTNPPSLAMAGGVANTGFTEEQFFDAFTRWFQQPGNENNIPGVIEKFPVYDADDRKRESVTIGGFVKALRKPGRALSVRLKDLFLANHWQLSEKKLEDGSQGWTLESDAEWNDRKQLAALQAFTEANGGKFPTTGRRVRVLVWGEDLHALVGNLSIPAGRVRQAPELQEFLVSRGAVVQQLAGDKWRVSRWPVTVPSEVANPVTLPPPEWWPGRSRYLTADAAAPFQLSGRYRSTQDEIPATAAAFEAVAGQGLARAEADLYVAYSLWFQRHGNENSIPRVIDTFALYDPRDGRTREVEIGAFVSRLRGGGGLLSSPLRSLLESHYWRLSAPESTDGHDRIWRLEAAAELNDRKYIAAFSAFLSTHDEMFPSRSSAGSLKVWGENLGEVVNHLMRQTGRKKNKSGFREFLVARGVEVEDVDAGKWRIKRLPKTVTASAAKEVKDDPPVWWPGRSRYVRGGGGGVAAGGSAAVVPGPVVSGSYMSGTGVLAGFGEAGPSGLAGRGS
ncbi:hypothetical protein ABZT06_49700, partial [Streptomyces sp. NPDC005483]|uniref:hypothetical protein n=1 Tax=Streptomyces sp. NPDC005483 TaxID=3154882 RepID=UPI0033B41082